MASQKPYHRIVPPREYGEPVLVLAHQPLDVGPHAFGLALQHDDDGGMPTQLQQVQEALSGSRQRSVTAARTSRGGGDRKSQPDLKLLVHQSCSR